MKQNIEIDIKELVLQGFSYGDRYRIGEAVKCELAHMLTERNLPSLLSQGGEFEHLDSKAFEIEPGSKPEVIGAQVAQSVYGGFTK